MWRSSNPPWGVVRAVIEDDEHAIVLDDLNGDRREVELSAFRRHGGEWDELFTSTINVCRTRVKPAPAAAG